MTYLLRLKFFYWALWFASKGPGTGPGYTITLSHLHDLFQHPLLYLIISSYLL